jgi:NAD(P)H-dependent FMN reductase
MKFLIYLGTLRQGAYSAAVAQFAWSVAQKRTEHSFELIDPRTLGLKFDDEGETAYPPELRAKVAAADGYLIVSPEYNHGYPGTIKYLLDLCLKEYNHKPVAFVGVSMSAWGGTRMIEALVGSVRELGLVPCQEDVNVSFCRKEIADGKFVEPAKWEERVNHVLDEFLWLAQTLREGREKYPKERP